MKIFLGDRDVCAFEYTYQLLEDRITFSDHMIVDKPEEADLIVFPSTCSGTAVSMNNTVNYIKNVLKKKKPSAKTYLTGCITRSIYNDKRKPDSEISEYFISLRKYLEQNIDFIVSDGDIDRLMQLMFSCDDKLSSKVEQPHYYVEQYQDYAIANIYIGRGCLNDCTFCKATYQDLKLVSTDINQIKGTIDIINRTHISPQLYLTASNVTQYGLDLYGEYMLPELLKHIDAKDNITTVGLMGFAFKDAIKQNFTQVISDGGQPLILASGLESGSNRILSLMKKGYTNDEIKHFIGALREKRKVGLSLNIIAGFPTETIEDIEMTVDLLSEINPYNVNLCTYTDSPFVPSHKLPQLHPQDVLEHAEMYAKKLEKRHIPHIKSF